jgi:hypothetical protein
LVLQVSGPCGDWSAELKSSRVQAFTYGVAAEGERPVPGHGLPEEPGGGPQAWGVDDLAEPLVPDDFGDPGVVVQPRRHLAPPVGQPSDGGQRQIRTGVAVGVQQAGEELVQVVPR